MSKLEINIDINDTIQKYLLSKDEAEQLAQQVINRVSSEIRRHWIKKAGENLKSTRAEYQRGVVIAEKGRMKNSIMLLGKLNNMIELGSSPYDMKKGFSRSSKVKRNKDGGWYLTIPFRHAVPTSLGENIAFSGKLPRPIHKIAKNQTVTTKDLPDQFKVKMSRRAIQNSSLSIEQSAKYEHKAPLFSGTKNMGTQGHSQYMTFRRVSSNSSPNSWIHRGMKAHNLAKKALQSVGESGLQTIIDNTIHSFINNR